MSEQVTGAANEKIDLLNLPYATRRALGNYALTLQRAHEVETQLRIATEAIEQVNRGLPDGFKVGTKSSFTHLNDLEGRSGYNKIYRPNNENQYEVVGEMCTQGSKKPFLGDRLLKIDDGLVVINDELQLGFSVKDEVFIVDTHNDPSERTLGGSTDERFRQGLLPMIEAVPVGGSEAFDCLYY
jgi:hypothetical protein